MRKFTVMIALLLVVALATPAIGASFPDVPSNHWAYEAINELVAAGIIEGYPDGTYKGQRNLTRYEIAMIVSRVMDNMAEERAALMDKVESMEKKDSGLTTEQAQDVTAIVKALMEKNMPEAPEAPTELTDQQADQVVNLIEALTFEYQAELKVLRSDYDSLRADLGLLEDNLASVEERVTALENETPPVTFSGSYSVSATHRDVTKGDNSVDLGSAFNYYYVDAAPSDLDEDDYKEVVANVIETRIQDLFTDNQDQARFTEIADYYNGLFDDDLTYDEVNEGHLAEIAVYEFNHALTGYGADPTGVTGYFAASNGAIDTGDIDTEIDNFDTDMPALTTSIYNQDYIIQEDTSDESLALPMWDEGDSDAMAFEETAELTHTLNLNADINYGGFTGQAGISLEKLSSTDEVTFKSANLELENDEMVMVYNEANSVDYSDFAVYDQTFNAASFLYKPWGLSTFAGIDAVDTGDTFDELDVVWDENAAGTAYEVTFDGVSDDMTDYYVVGAQKTFALDMANVTTTFASRMNTDFEVESDADEDMVFGAEGSATLSGVDLMADVAASTDTDSEEYGTMFRINASTELTNAFTAGFDYKNRGENFSPLYENDAVFDDDDAAYDKYGAGLAEEMSGYGVSVNHDGSADNALVAGLDLDFGYDAVDYGEDENDTKMGLSGSMAVMENLTVNGSYTQLDEPSGNTDYDRETKMYSVGADFVPVENANVSASYSVNDPVEDDYTSDNGNSYAGQGVDVVNETTMSLSGSYDFTDYVSANASYKSIDGLDYYDGAKKSTTGLGVSLSDYPVMEGLTASASVDYESSTGEKFNDLDVTPDNTEDFNTFDVSANADLALEELETTKTTLKGGLAYTLNEKTALTYDLTYTTQEADDEVSELYSGNYMTNAVGVDYTFTEDASVTADYKHMNMDYDEGDGDEDWTAHELTAGVSISF